jgi:uncharacterized protein (TIGR04222 family)
LTHLEEQVLAAVQFNPKPGEIYSNALLQSTVQDTCASWHAFLETQALLLPRSVKLARKRVLWIGVSALLGVGLLKLLLGWAQGRTDIGWLMLLMAIATGELLVMAAVIANARLSKRGNAWLAQLRLVYSSAKTEAVARRLNASSEPRSANAYDGAGLFVIGLYGFEILRGTSDEAFAQHFKVGANASVSACGAGSCGGGGGSCGGGGCGGGCGG